MASQGSSLLKVMRPRQWLKNISLLTGVVFSGWLFMPEKILTVTQAIIVFCFISAAVYIFNDIIDAPSDRKHPLKKDRPIASGELPLPVAVFAMFFCLIIALVYAWTLSQFFFLLTFFYVLLNASYTIWLKHITIIDVLAIATGFVLRVYAGAVAVNAHINVWLLLCLISFSLFLAIGKRRSEKTLLEAKHANSTRQVLYQYPDQLLNIYTAMFATTTWLTYALFSFQQPLFIRHGFTLSLMAVLPRTFVNEKLLMVSVPLVIYGVMRYLHLIYVEDQGESPADVLLSDKPLLITIIIWGFMVVTILYGLT